MPNRHLAVLSLLVEGQPVYIGQVNGSKSEIIAHPFFAEIIGEKKYEMVDYVVCNLVSGRGENGSYREVGIRSAAVMNGAEVEIVHPLSFGIVGRLVLIKDND